MSRRKITKASPPNDEEGLVILSLDEFTLTSKPIQGLSPCQFNNERCMFLKLIYIKMASHVASP